MKSQKNNQQEGGTDFAKQGRAEGGRVSSSEQDRDAQGQFAGKRDRNS